jgi:hypothetical protein
VRRLLVPWASMIGAGMVAASFAWVARESAFRSFENPTPPWWAWQWVWALLSLTTPGIVASIVGARRPVLFAVGSICTSLIIYVGLERGHYVPALFGKESLLAPLDVAQALLVQLGLQGSVAAIAAWAIARLGGRSPNPSLERP